MSSEKIYTVSDLTHAIKACIEPPFRFISVEGEVGNCTLHSSGHLYFTLKDKNAQIAAVLFKGYTKTVPRLPKSGDQITIKGDISIYPPRGGYQIIVKSFSFAGRGALLLELEKRKEELKARGWLDPQHKKALPLFPKKIGVVTSPTGAVIQDILHVLTRRFSNFHLILNPVNVQGEGSAEEIAQAIYDCNKYNVCDLLIVGRGGGSLEDLWSFNEEIVAKAIFESKIPIISAVGHETDYSIADLVADVRAPTPSAAAEIAMQEKLQIQKNLATFSKQLAQIMIQKISENKKTLFHLAKHPLFSTPYALLKTPIQVLDELQEKLHFTAKHFMHKKREHVVFFEKQTRHLNPLIGINLAKQKMAYLTTHLDQQLRNYIKMRKEAFDSKDFFNDLVYSLKKSLSEKKQLIIQLDKHLRSLDPQNLLEKGYSICFSEKDGSIILSTKEIETNENISIQLSDGKIKAKIKEKL